MNSTTKQLGNLGENLAVLVYERNGFTILERNYRAGAYEIDIIAKRKNVIHLVEVKYRKSITDAQLAVSQFQLTRVARAGQRFMQGRDEFMQIDAFLVDDKLQWERIANIMLEHL